MTYSRKTNEDRKRLLYIWIGSVRVQLARKLCRLKGDIWFWSLESKWAMVKQFLKAQLVKHRFNAWDPHSIPARTSWEGMTTQPSILGSPDGSAEKDLPTNGGPVMIPEEDSPLEGHSYPPPVFWHGEFHGLYSPWKLQDI